MNVIKTNDVILSSVDAAGNAAVKKQGQCFDYNPGNIRREWNPKLRKNVKINKYWDQNSSLLEEKNKADDMKSVNVNLYVDENNDRYYCFTPSEKIYLETKESQGGLLDITLIPVNYFFGGSNQNPFDDIKCAILNKNTHTDCDKIRDYYVKSRSGNWKLIGDQNKKNKLNAFYSGGIPTLPLGATSPPSLPIFSNTTIFDNPPITDCLSIDDIFSILYMSQTSTKDEIKACLHNRSAMTFACLYKPPIGIPDKGHHRQIQIYRLVLSLDLFNTFDQNVDNYYNTDVYTDLYNLQNDKFIFNISKLAKFLTIILNAFNMDKVKNIHQLLHQGKIDRKTFEPNLNAKYESLNFCENEKQALKTQLEQQFENDLKQLNEDCDQELKDLEQKCENEKQALKTQLEQQCENEKQALKNQFKQIKAGEIFELNRKNKIDLEQGKKESFEQGAQLGVQQALQQGYKDGYKDCLMRVQPRIPLQ
jgi:hypothetical protein